MSVNLRIALIIGSVIFLVALTFFSRKMKMKNDYAVIWIVLSSIILLLSIFPNLIVSITNMLNIDSPVNGVYLIFILVLLSLVFYLFVKLSVLESKFSDLVQKVAINQSNKNKQNNK